MRYSQLVWRRRCDVVLFYSSFVKHSLAAVSPFLHHGPSRHPVLSYRPSSLHPPSALLHPGRSIEPSSKPSSCYVTPDLSSHKEGGNNWGHLGNAKRKGKKREIGRGEFSVCKTVSILGIRFSSAYLIFWNYRYIRSL